VDPRYRWSQAWLLMAPVRISLSRAGLRSGFVHGQAHVSGPILRVQRASPRSRGRQVRYCAVAALPGMRFGARPGTDAPFSCTRHETTEMMTISGGSCGAGALKQTAACVVPPTPIVPTMTVTRWACPAPSASCARAPAFPSRGLARYVAVPPTVTGTARTPVGVAATSLSTGHGSLENVKLDAGWLRPAGGRPVNARTVADGRRPTPARPGPRQASAGPDPGPARPGWNRRQAAELIPS
jgi:hypothetical protein